ncbi:MAG: DUF4403 family protein [Chitinophagaceae bacterium]|nr:DUF4403 family protein [Chitinophagaceae bacterium]
MYKRFLYYMPLVILLSSCFSQKNINPSHPDLSPANFKLDSLPESEINIPIQINLRPLYYMAEQSVDTFFNSPGYPDDWVQDGCATRYKYEFRRSPLQFNGIGNQMKIGFRGFYRIIGSTRVCVNGTVLSPWTPPCRCGFGSESERRVDVSFSNTFSITPDFRLHLTVKRDPTKPLDKCKVCFWGQDITGQVMKGLEAELDSSKADMEKDYGTTNLKPYFQQVWSQLTQNYNLYNLGWLQINPQRFRVNNLFINNDSLNAFIGLTAKPVISFEQPAAKDTTMPNLGGFSRNPGFSIFLDAVLNYDSLSRILNSQIAGKTFNFKRGFINKQFIIDNCRIYGGGFDQLVIQVNFSGTNSGVVYLLGQPTYDAATKTIAVENIDFDIKSKNILLGSADWLFNKKITRTISDYARFDLSTYIDSAKLNINQQLNREWMEGIRSSGSIDDIRIIRFYPMQEHLIIRNKCSGNFAIKVNSIDLNF